MNSMDDHDQRIKELLQEFLPEFMELFFPRWIGRFVFSKAEWLKQDAFLDPPEGERRQIDLLAKMPTTVPPGDRAKECLLLIHIEVESAESATRLRNRMPQYYAYLRRHYGLPVLPIGLFLYVGLGGIGKEVYEETVWGETLLQFTYFTIGLPALDGLAYHRGPNLLGVALSALMKLPAADRARFLAEGLERFQVSGENELRKYLLAECYDHYLPVNETEREDARRLMAERFTEGKTIMNGLELRERRGELRGELRGRLQEKREMVAKLLRKKFISLPDSIVAEINALPAERLDEIALASYDVNSLADLGLGSSKV